MEVRGVLETGERNNDSHRSDATGRHSPECRASPSGTQQPDRFSDSVRFPADPPEGDAKVEELHVVSHRADRMYIWHVLRALDVFTPKVKTIGGMRFQRDAFLNQCPALR